MSAYAVLLCAGSGTRMGAEQNKTLLKVGGLPACVRAYKTLMRHAEGAVVVVRDGEQAAFERAFSHCGETPYRIVPGGRDRQASVFCGLSALPCGCDTVLIHDGARPLVSDKTVESCLNSARQFGTGVAAVPVRDTIKRADGEKIVLETLKRDELYAMQTPQAFTLSLIRRAHETAAERMTDDAALVEKLGVPVRLVMSDCKNIKLTSREDLMIANAFCGAPSMRVGQGYDAHRLAEGRALILCGVQIPFERGLLGHSDADVAVHALMDAMLGAAGLLDIGSYFPDTDERYRGISSIALLEKVGALAAKAGYELSNADVTIIAQSPKLSPYREQMRDKLADALGCSPQCIAVKATTTEKMGFEGRGEGISAQASVLLTAIEMNY